MKRFKIEILSAVLAVLASAGIILADGSITVTNTVDVGTVNRMDLYWNSLTNRSDGSVSWFCGEIKRVTIITYGTQTNNHVVKITDNNSIDVLQGAGVCTSNQTVDTVPALQMYNATIGATSAVPIVVNSSLTVAVTNTGVSKGRVSIYYK